MRRTRWLLLAAILVVLGGTGFTYLLQRKINVGRRTPAPPALPHNTTATAADWEWSRNDSGRRIVQMKARGYRQIADTGRFELDQVQLNLFQNDGQHYDLVKSPKADFNQTEGKLLSNGEVEITLNVPTDGAPPHQLTSIRTSGITFESKTGKASTDLPARFQFQGGDGSATGATYDPNTRELHLTKNVLLNLHGAEPGSKTMKVEAPELIYKEKESEIWLLPTARLTRNQSVIDAGASLISLNSDRKIQTIAAHAAKGTDVDPKRKLDYSADLVTVYYGEDGEMQRIVGLGNGHLLSTAAASTSNLTADSVTMEFTDQDGEATLTHVSGNGHAVVESKPLPDPAGKTKTAETRVLKSSYVDVFMRPGGQEIESIKTPVPGTLDFFPNMPDQHRRLLTGDKMNITYGPENRIQFFESTDVTTETWPSDVENRKAAKSPKPPANSHTASANMSAEFDNGGQLKRLRQWDHFTYHEGERQARSVLAVLENDKNLMDLEREARIWDATGSTDADHIQIDQKTGDYKADGHVNTSRLPDKKDSAKPNAAKNAGSSGMLDDDKPVQGRADRMVSTNKNHFVHYEGNAVLWQESDRIQSDRIDIDREKHTVKAEGKVVTQLLDKQRDEPVKPETAKAAAKAFTIVKAPEMLYTDDNRLAYYSGGAVMNRPGLFVKAKEIRAFLKEEKKSAPATPGKTVEKPADEDEDSGSRLDKAFADTDVEIIDTTPIRKRTGTGHHAEYYADEDKVILRGEQALLVDSLKGTSAGAELTYYTAEDKVVVASAPKKQQVKTHLTKRKK